MALFPIIPTGTEGEGFDDDITKPHIWLDLVPEHFLQQKTGFSSRAFSSAKA